MNTHMATLARILAAAIALQALPAAAFFMTGFRGPESPSEAPSYYSGVSLLFTILLSAALSDQGWGGLSDALVDLVRTEQSRTTVHLRNKANDAMLALEIPNEALEGKEIRVGDAAEVVPQPAGLIVKMTEAKLAFFVALPDSSDLLHSQRIGVVQ